MKRVLVTGSSGMIGQAVMQALRQRGDQPIPLLRGTAVTAGQPWWRPDLGTIDLTSAGPISGVVHLAGENIGRPRWTGAIKTRLWSSRVDATKLLVDAFKQLPQSPTVMVAASGVGYYGSRGLERLTETAPPGRGFLSELCVAWERESLRATSPSTRVACARLGVALATDGGTLKRLLPIFRLGLGGRLGSGKQFMSWIALEDLVRGLLFAFDNPSLSGPFNLVTPEAVTNTEFTQALANQMRRPTAFPVPRFVLRTLFGEVADELLLSSTYATPERLTEAGFTWTHPTLSSALHNLLPS